MQAEITDKRIARMTRKTKIVLYTAQTPNGIKVPILLEELGLLYEVRKVNILKNEQKEPSFLAINPNGRIPAMTDEINGEEIHIFESGAMLQYIIDKYDNDHRVSYPRNTREHWEVTSWLMWQMGGLGPMQGQSNHFQRYAPARIEYGLHRYGNETRRLYRVLNEHLAKSPHGFIVGDRVTIADISCWGWVASHKWAGVCLANYPSLHEWLLRLLRRLGFEKGRHVPEAHRAFDTDSLTENEINELAAESRIWVQNGMEQDALQG